MADSPLIDLLRDDYRILRRLSFDEMQDFLTDVDRRGWEWARLSLVRYHHHRQQEEAPYGVR
jgi:hypothetical protein